MADSNTRPKRILILGKSGSGKSTLARKLSTLLEIQHIELDTIFWNPGWVETPPARMREHVEAQITPNSNWVVDGNYMSCADITWACAELIIWLDFPIIVNLWRLFWRSLSRMWTGEKVCGGNYESGRALLWPTAEYNILLCCWGQGKKHAREYPKLIRDYGQGKMMVFRSQRECDVWLEIFRGKVEH